MVKVSDIVGWFDNVAPRALAASWDNTGLLLGDPAGEVLQIMTCLTLTIDVAREAVDKKVDLVITHHPIPFKPIKNLSATTAEGKILWLLASHGISVFSPHTRWDDSSIGINQALAGMIGLSEFKPLESARGPVEVKLVTFVPKGHVEQVRSALFGAGAGFIGNYSECSFQLSGTGTFRGNEESSPVVGQKGNREEVHEERLEVVCPVGKLDEVVAALRLSHPYEEPAFDLISLAQKPLNSGTGVIGTLADAIALGKLVEKFGAALNVNSLQWIGDASRKVNRVAIVCGSGGGLLEKAFLQGADCFITGEMRFHDSLAVREANATAILLGHFASERFSMDKLAVLLKDSFPMVVSQASECEIDPLNFWIKKE